MGGKSKKKGKKPKKEENDPILLKEKGVKAFQNHNMEQAIEYFSKAIELDPENHFLYGNRSAAYLIAGNEESALVDADKAITISPDYIKAYYRKAQAMREMDLVKEGLQLLESVIDRAPEDQAMSILYKLLQTEFEEDNVLPPDHREREVFEKFQYWLTSSGAKFEDRIKMRYYSQDYRGVHAKRNIKKGEIFLYIPKECIITLEMARETPIGSQMHKAQLKLISPKHSFLSSYILQEKKKEVTIWKEYLDILPHSFDSFPIFFSKDEKEWLSGSPFLKQVEEKIEDIATDYNNIVRAVPDFGQFTLHQYSQIRMMVSSRIFGMNIDNVKTDGFVPMADMLNHKRPRQTSWSYTDEKKGFIIEALQDIKRGEGIYDSYGKKCNSRFLLNYGFIVENNDGNEVPLKVHFHSTDPLLSLKLELLKTEQEHKSFRVSNDLTENIMSNFISFLRYVEFTGNGMKLIQLEAQAKAHRHQNAESDEEEERIYTGNNIPPLSIGNEKKALLHMREIANKQLKEYTTTCEEDLQILQQMDLTFNQRNCVLMRSGEKEVLIFLMKLADLALELLDMPMKVFIYCYIWANQ